MRKRVQLDTKKMVYTAVLIAIATIANYYTIYLLNRVLAVSFTYLPCFVAGVFLGPVYGLAVGIAGDFLGLVFSGNIGLINPFILIASGLLGLIPGLVFRYIKLNNYAKIVISFLICLLICTAGLNTFGIWIYGSRSKTFWAFLLARLPWQTLMVTVNVGITYAIFNPLKKYVFKPYLFVPPEVAVSASAADAENINSNITNE
ncbi:MAG: folate family ECF transporter S component [Clostridia bacterium]|nr:folate family ECF transporter S component [Clostridia bacterium]